MTIIFNYLFTRTDGGFKTRVPVRILNGPLLQKGLDITMTDLTDIDLHQWEGKSLNVTIQEGIHTINGLAEVH